MYGSRQKRGVSFPNHITVKISCLIFKKVSKYCVKCISRQADGEGSAAECEKYRCRDRVEFVSQIVLGGGLPNGKIKI
jgi:hypothetical protein